MTWPTKTNQSICCSACMSGLYRREKLHLHLSVPATCKLTNFVDICKSWSETKKTHTDANHPCTHLIALCLCGHFCCFDLATRSWDQEFKALLPKREQLPGSMSDNGFHQLIKEYRALNPILPGPVASRPAGPFEVRLVLQPTRRGWAFAASKAEEAERNEKCDSSKMAGLCCTLSGSCQLQRTN